MFNDYLKNALIVFTNWPTDKNSKAMRRKQKNTEEDKQREYNLKIQEQLKFDTTTFPIPCFFSDIRYFDPELREMVTEEEKALFDNELQKLKRTALGLPKFYCDQMKAVKTENDRLQGENMIAVRARQVAEQEMINAEKIRKEELETSKMQRRYEENREKKMR
jgi:hypothetical protein